MIERGGYIYISHIYIYRTWLLIHVCVFVWHCMPKSYLLCIHTHIYIYTYNMQPFCCPRSRGDIPFFWTQGCSHTGWHHRTQLPLQFGGMPMFPPLTELSLEISAAGAVRKRMWGSACGNGMSLGCRGQVFCDDNDGNVWLLQAMVNSSYSLFAKFPTLVPGLLDTTLWRWKLMMHSRNPWDYWGILCSNDNPPNQPQPTGAPKIFLGSRRSAR